MIVYLFDSWGDFRENADVFMQTGTRLPWVLLIQYRNQSTSFLSLCLRDLYDEIITKQDIEL